MWLILGQNWNLGNRAQVSIPPSVGSGTNMCGVEVWRGGLGGTYLLPTLSVAGASLFPPCFRFHTPLIGRGGSAPASLFFGACSAFTKVTACKLAKSPLRPSAPEASAVSLPPLLL